MGAQRRITDDQRALIARLIRVEHRPHADVQKLCAEGIYGIEPFHVAKSTISEIARENRLDGALDLGEAPLAQIFDRLARDALTIGHRELERMKATAGKLDADHYLKIARTLRELQPLVKPNTNQGQDRQTFLGTLKDQQHSDTTRNEEETNKSDSPQPSAIEQLEDVALAA